MNTNIINEIIKKHDKAEIILSCFFGSIDAILYLVLICLFGCEFNKKCCSARQKLSFVIIIDFLFRITNFYITSFVFSLTKEVINTAFATFQFLLILMLLNQIFSDNKLSLSESGEIASPILTSFGFILLVINFDFPKILLLVQYTAGILCIFVYGYYLKRKINFFSSNVEKRNPNYSGKVWVYNLPLFIPMYFIIYFAIKVLVLIMKDRLHASYMEMASEIFKEVGKYFTFILIIFLYNLYNKYIKEDDDDYSSNANSGSVNIASIGSSNFN